MNRERMYKLLLLLSLIFTVLAVITLIPNPNASKVNIMGYKSVCTFAPAATFLCGLLAGTTCTIRARYFKPAGARRKNPAFIILLAICIGFSGFYTYKYVNANSKYEAIIANTSLTGINLDKTEDGEYIGEYAADPLYVKVKTTVKGHKITAIEILQHANDGGEAAEAIVDRVLEAQSIEVEAISGATSSCEAILKAIENSLNK
ncbi:MAG: FMN-binding protein [Bacillota bacterium]